MYLIQCNNCNANGFTEQAQNPDAMVRCTTAAGDPPGSPDGSCCTVHESHEHHADHVAATGDATCRPVTITALPGSASLLPAGG
jgi:hypothetical protein